MTAAGGRGGRRREALVVAAARLLGEGGPAAVTARAVAARAGVPLAAVTYYFDGVGTLVGEAADRAAAAHLEAAAALVADGGGRRWEETLVRAWTDPSPEGPDPGRVRGTLQQVLLAAAVPALAPALQRWDAALVRLVEQVLRGAGRDVSRTRLLLAALDGAALARLGGVDARTGSSAGDEPLLDGLVADLRAAADHLAPPTGPARA